MYLVGASEAAEPRDGRRDEMRGSREWRRTGKEKAELSSRCERDDRIPGWREKEGGQRAREGKRGVACRG